MPMSRLAATLVVPFAIALPRVGAAAAVETQVRDAEGKPVADVVVWAMPAVGAVESRGNKTVAIAQIDREFVPYVTVLQTGTAASFPNRDPILHHVYSFSAAKSFEIKLYSGKSPSQILFDRPGLVTLGCNIHDWMVGYVMVVSTPYFGKTDASGSVRLHDLPSGNYQLHLWHPQQRASASPSAITLDASVMPILTFNLEIVPRKAKYKPPLDRLKY
jgi:plastocyanin